MRVIVSVLAAIVVTVATVVALLLWDRDIAKAEAIRTGGLAGGAIVALYALWLNDRRRRTEEARHELETERIVDERFARSVEMLGNEADQVRVGAMHALAGLARSRPAYAQTVLDILCAYLRRPFQHEAYDDMPADPDQSWAKDTSENDRERQVRLTAQRLITVLLDFGEYDLDLTGAHLEYFKLTRLRVGRVTARRAQFYGITELSLLHSSGPVLFSGAAFLGRVNCGGAHFAGGLSLVAARFEGEWRQSNATIGTFADLTTEPPRIQVGELRIEEGTRLKGTRDWALAVGDRRFATRSDEAQQ